MLTLAELSALERSLRDTHVLSVYVGPHTPDPAQRHSWHPTLAAALRDLSHTLDTADRAERLEFAAARDALQNILDDAIRLECEGIACFLTARGLKRIVALPFAVEPTVVWSRGVAVAPFVRALKEERPVVLAVMHGTKAIVHRYQLGSLALLESFDSAPVLTAPEQDSARVSPRFHRGVRGETGRDAVQREWGAATDRLVHHVVQQITHAAGEDAWVLVGGRRDVVHRVLSLLPPSVRRRADQAVGATPRSTQFTLIKAARLGASRLRNAADAEALGRLAEGAAARGAAAVGELAARHALEQARVQQLYVSSRFVHEHADAAEFAVRAALEQGAKIETVSGEASIQLDAMGGIAARLRYAMRPAEVTAAGHSVV
jgi:hypothetical protein